MVIPILIKTGLLQGMTNAQYIQLLQQVLASQSQKELDNRVLMSLYKHQRKFQQLCQNIFHQKKTFKKFYIFSWWSYDIVGIIILFKLLNTLKLYVPT